MQPRVYYNDNDPRAVEWIKNLIAEGEIPDGEVDGRSITEVQPGDLRGFNRVHLFAGIAGWELACQLARWPDDLDLWTASCPCQPFSAAGKKLGADDPRHLWPHVLRLARPNRPARLVGEQVAGKAGYAWFDGVAADLGTEGYAGRSIDIPASAVDAPQIRQRQWWAFLRGSREVAGEREGMAGADARGRQHGPEARLHDQGPPGHDADRCDVHGGGAGQRLGDPRAAGRSEAAARRAEPLARAPGQRRWQLLEERGPEGRAAAAGDDAGEQPGDLGRAEEQRRGTGLREAHEVGHGPFPSDADGASGGEARDVASSERGRREGGHEGDGIGDRPGAANAPAYGYSLPNGSWWSDHRWIVCHDGKARRVPDPAFPLLAAGVSGGVAVLRTGEVVEAAHPEARIVSRVAAWKGFGNAINARLAAEVLGALIDGP